MHNRTLHYESNRRHDQASSPAKVQRHPSFLSTILKSNFQISAISLLSGTFMLCFQSKCEEHGSQDPWADRIPDESAHQHIQHVYTFPNLRISSTFPHRIHPDEHCIFLSPEHNQHDSFGFSFATKFDVSVEQGRYLHCTMHDTRSKLARINSFSSSRRHKPGLLYFSLV